MKRMIIIRILCLLLCISIISPTVVSAAAQPPLYQYPSVDITVSDGMEITNEMAYVDRFFYESGAYSPLGDDLIKWLKMDPIEGKDGDKWPSERNFSGYLMLEQEMVHQESFSYKKAEIAAKIVQPIAEIIASHGLSLVISLIEEAAFQTKFPWAGKSAYPYYTQLSQIYMQYAADLSTELNAVDDDFKQAAELIENVVAVTGDSITVKIKTVIEEKEIAGVKTKVLGLYGTRDGSAIIRQAKDVDTKKGLLYYESVTSAGTKIKSVPLRSLDDNVLSNNKAIFYEYSGMPDSAQKELDNWIDANAITYKSGREVLCGADYRVFDAYYDTVNEIPNLNRQGRMIFNKIDTIGKKKEIIKRKEIVEEKDIIVIPDGVKKIGDLADKAGKVVQVYQTIQKYDFVTAQQISYLNVLTDVSARYLDMLGQWYAQIPESETDMRVALAVMISDILELQKQSAEKLSSKIKENAQMDGLIFASKDFADTVLSLAENSSGIKGLKDAVKTAASALAEKTGEVGTKVSGAVSKVNWGAVTGYAAITSAVFNLFSGGLKDFDEATQAVFDLKNSLVNFLIDEKDGLLPQYREKPTHEKACMIIDALYTIKSAKLVGESIWESYYLFNLFDSLGIKQTPAVNVVYWNELMNRTKYGISIKEDITNIIAVYEDTAVAEKENGSIESIEVSTKILGYYLQQDRDSAVFNGVNLTPLPESFLKLSNFPPQYPKNAQHKGITLSEDWLKGKSVVGGTPKTKYYDNAQGLWEPLNPLREVHIMYRNDNMRLYSANGLEVILTKTEYDSLVALLHYVDDLWEEYKDPSREYGFFEGKQKKESELLGRIEAITKTRRWIEDGVKMYDASDDHISLTKRLRLGWAQMNP